MKLSKSIELIILCWLVYTSSYIGRLSYNANIIQIREYFNVSYSETGLVSTFFFFVYGFGQIVNGLLCKKYNVKYTIFTCLIISSLMNFLLININDFNLIKYLWLINGASMSFLWTSLIRILSECLDKKDINKAVIVMGTTVAIGTFFVYGLSSIFNYLNNFKLIFYVASILLIIVAIIWIVRFNYLVNSLKENIIKEEKEIRKVNNKGIIVIILTFSIYAISNNFIKDGLTNWTPSILDSIYHTEDWLSILLTLTLPLFAVFGTALATLLHKKIKDFNFLCVVLFLISSIFLSLVVIFINSDALVITLISFAFTACLMASVNNVITSMLPLHMKDKYNSGLLAGVLNGFCYIGSTFSTYGLGLIADKFNWNIVLYTLLITSLIVLLIGFINLLINREGGEW